MEFVSKPYTSKRLYRVTKDVITSGNVGVNYSVST